MTAKNVCDIFGQMCREYRRTIGKEFNIDSGIDVDIYHPYVMWGTRELYIKLCQEYCKKTGEEFGIYDCDIARIAKFTDGTEIVRMIDGEFRVKANSAEKRKIPEEFIKKYLDKIENWRKRK